MLVGLSQLVQAGQAGFQLVLVKLNIHGQIVYNNTYNRHLEN